MRRIIMAVSNDLATDQRVQRVAQSLTNAGFSVTLIGRKLKTSMPISFSYKTVRFSLLATRGPLFYALLNWRIFWFVLFQKFDAAVANDLDTLVGVALATKLRRRKLVYDSHELFTELPELVNRPKTKRIWQTIERIFVPKVDAAYTVCQSIANIYNSLYNKNFAVVRNVPQYINAQSPERQKNVLMYQGALNVGRGIDLMIETMRLLPNCELWIAGSGDVEQQLRAQANAQTDGGKVVFLGKLSPSELRTYTNKATIGLSLEEDLGLNYHYALPNKLFDYIQARIPVIVSNLPEMRAIVEQYKIGTVLTNRTPQALAQTVEQMLQISDTYTNNISLAASELCWQNEEKTLIDIYNQLW